MAVSALAVSATTLYAAEITPPVVTTPTSASITSTGATLGGDVTSDGLDTILERGVVYSVTATNDNPEIGGPGVTTATSAGTTGVFTAAITGLAPGTSYSFKAYATNNLDTSYTDVATFTTVAITPAITAPTSGSLFTDPETTVSSAELGGTVTVAGAEISERGVVYALETVNNNPIIGGNGVTKVVGVEDTEATLGAFTVEVPDLAPYTTYRFKAYITNAAGTRYTAVSSFTTPDVAPPVSAVPTQSDVNSYGATLGGEVLLRGGRPIAERGVLVTLASGADPVLGGAGVVKHVITPANTLGDFTIVVTGLDPNTDYKFRAFARNAAGVNYSDVDTFTTTADLPTVATPTKTGIGAREAIIGGHVTKTGGAAVTQRGVVFSVTADNADPLIGGGDVTQRVSGSGTGVFTIPLTGLTPNTQYSFKAYATNSVGTSYTAVTTFTTLTAVPTVTTPASSSITSTGATIGGNVTLDNGAAITQRGVVYSLSTTNGNPLIGGPGVTRVIVAGTTGEFSAPITGLEPAKRYSFKAYATNARGTTYTSVATFTTSAGAPTITSPTQASITATKAKLGGNVTKSNGATITGRGIVISETDVNDDPEIDGDGVTQKANTLATVGPFVVNVGGLTPNTEYSFKAYVTSTVNGDPNTTYTAVSTFTTRTAPPTLDPDASSSRIDSREARLSGEVLTDNGEAITERGVVYSLTSVNRSPKVGAKGVSKATTTGTTGSFNVDVTGLKPGKQYSFRAYAKNAKGTRYSTVSRFTTDPEAPTVNSPTSTLIKTTSAKIGGRVPTANGAPILERGVVYSTTRSTAGTLQIGNGGVTRKTTTGTTGRFRVSITGLTAGTEYFFRAYARNSVGTTYSDVASFTTLGSATSALVVEASLDGGSAAATSAADSTETYYTIDPKDGSKYLTIVINKAAGTEQQARVVEVSGDLVEWFSGSDHTTVLTDDAGILKVRDNTPVTPGNKRYIRLKP